jgi:hypothetical protein
MMAEAMKMMESRGFMAPAGMAMGMPMMQMNMMMMPRASMKMEKMDGGMKIMCSFKDPEAMAMMQNLCAMLEGGMMSCSMMMNGMQMMTCNMMMGMCKCETMANGMTMSWTSGDAMMSTMIQDCCSSMMSMKDCGCTMVLSMNNTPICCC